MSAGTKKSRPTTASGLRTLAEYANVCLEGKMSNALVVYQCMKDDAKTNARYNEDTAEFFALQEMEIEVKFVQELSRKSPNLC